MAGHGTQRYQDDSENLRPCDGKSSSGTDEKA